MTIWALREFIKRYSTFFNFFLAPAIACGINIWRIDRGKEVPSDCS